jgi:hypothetical protein
MEFNWTFNVLILITKYTYSGDQTKKNEMAEACGMSGEQDTCTTGFGGKT